MEDCSRQIVGHGEKLISRLSHQAERDVDEIRTCQDVLTYLYVEPELELFLSFMLRTA